MAVANVINAFQTKYDEVMLPALQESAVNSIPNRIARLEQTEDAETVVFYNLSAASTKGQMDLTDGTDPGTSGNVIKFEATIEPFYAYRRVLKTEMNKTSLDLAGDFVKSFVRAVDRAVNINYLETIDAAKVGDEIGDNTKLPSEQIDTFITACELASIRVAEAPDYAAKALLIMNVEDYADLYKADKKINSLYSQFNSAKEFYGCEVMVFNNDVVPKGTSYVIPYGTTGFGYWSEVDSKAEYSPLFDGLACFAMKSGGTVVIEPGAIEVIKSLPA
jgi:hypothetical protein